MKSISIAIFVAGFLMSVQSIVVSQNAVFEYNTELCACTGTFDSTQYSREQLQNTFDLLWWLPYFEADATVWKFEEAKNLSISDLDRECTTIMKKLTALPFINNDFWNQIREERIREVSEACRLRHLTLLAYSTPDSLLAFETTDSLCNFYREALIDGGHKMIHAWFCLNEEMKAKNAYPDEVEARFKEKLFSDKALEYARVDIMLFGWWNNANGVIFHSYNSYFFEDYFKELFVDVNCECEEP